MNINYIHDLKNLNIKNLKEHQDNLKHEISLVNKIEIDDIKICAGVDVAYWDKDGQSFGACSIVLIDFKSKNILKKFSSVGTVTSEYVAGFLSAKELPLVIETASKIPDFLEPDIFIFDGNGVLHPKSMGIATHASFFLNKPTIGVAKSFLKINNVDYIEPKDKQFSYTEIKIKSKVKGVAFRSHKNTKPIFISPGNFIDLETSIKCVESLINKESKLPIATRYADIETHKLRNLYNK